MFDNKQIQARSQIKSVTYLAVVVNIVLFFLKISIGLLTGSISLIADGVHSLSDVTTDFGVIIGVRLAAKEPDHSHPYGHGRAETFSALFIALVLLLVGASIVYYAAAGIAKNDVFKPHYSILIAAIISLVLKELLYWITKLAAVKYHSAALYANAWHHRSDALSSIAVLIGFITLKLGYHYGDHLAGIAVGLIIILVAIQIISQCFGELAERAVDEQTAQHIKSIINSNPQIKQWHKLRTRTIAREIFLDLHILVDRQLNVVQAHEIAENLENALHQQLNRPVNITVHIEPDIPELRK
ncbi:MAG: cation transporter [Sedimentisphaerales bacterium]|nr:cation transporter [Sedimentisphaerales bacterium]